MKPSMIALGLLFTASCGGSTEENAAKDRAASKATWALVLKVDGADVRARCGCGH